MSSESIEIKKSDLEKVVIAVKEFKEHKFIDIRSWKKDDPRYTASHDVDGKPVELKWNPSHKGVTIPLDKASELKRAIDRLFAENEFEEEG